MHFRCTKPIVTRLYQSRCVVLSLQDRWPDPGVTGFLTSATCTSILQLNQIRATQEGQESCVGIGLAAVACTTGARAGTTFVVR